MRPGDVVFVSANSHFVFVVEPLAVSESRALVLAIADGCLVISGPCCSAGRHLVTDVQIIRQLSRSAVVLVLLQPLVLESCCCRSKCGKVDLIDNWLLSVSVVDPAVVRCLGDSLIVG